MVPPKDYPYYLANKPIVREEKMEVQDKFTNEVVARVSVSDAESVEQAIAAAVKAAPVIQKLSAFERKKILKHCLMRFKEKEKLLVEILCVEVGKTIKDAQSEVDRFLGTFEVSAEEATRQYGEILPLDISERGLGYRGYWKRFPIGPCLFITPFNFPLNLVAHKVAPAIAAGCPFILKPALATPISAAIMGEVLSETDLPRGAFSILFCNNSLAQKMAEDERLKLLSFTGSAKVGWDLKSKAGKKQVILELGGNAACIIDETADLDWAVERLIFGGYYVAGQSCISVQRILAHHTIYNSLREKLVSKLKAIKSGNPKESDVFLGPLINIDAAKRVEAWIKEAVQKGATLLCGGERKGAIVTAALLENVPLSEKLNCEEAFGPVAILQPFKEFNEALKIANDSRYGLQAGVFTRDLHRMNQAFDELEVGGVTINEVPSFRSDNMPYGGIKESGLGREGVRFAIDHLTEIKMLVVRDA